MDDWESSEGSHEAENDYRAIKLCTRADDGSLLHYTIHFQVAEGKTYDLAYADLKTCLKEYGLEDMLKEGSLVVITDHALYGAISPHTEKSNLTCGSHTLNRHVKRLFEKRAQKIPGFKQKYEE